MLKIGEKAPDFSLPNQNGEKISLTNLKGKWVVVYFYPKAQTPGCIVQACGIRDFNKEFEKLNTTVLGISADKESLLKRFEEKQSLNFELLGDEEKTTLKAYESWGLKKFMGREYDGIFRCTYIINPEGNIAHVMPKVKTKTHHEEVLSFLQENA